MQPGASVRAQDRAGDWLESKIVEWKHGKFLVHFLGWNSRFDEWLPRSSPKMRPMKSAVPASPPAKGASPSAKAGASPPAKAGASKPKLSPGAPPPGGFTSEADCQRCRGRHVAHTCNFRGAKTGEKVPKPAAKVAESHVSAAGTGRSENVVPMGKPMGTGWVGRTVKLVGKCAGAGKTGKVASMSGGQYIVRLLKPHQGEVRVRPSDMEEVVKKSPSPVSSQSGPQKKRSHHKKKLAEPDKQKLPAANNATPTALKANAAPAGTSKSAKVAAASQSQNPTAAAKKKPDAEALALARSRREKEKLERAAREAAEKERREREEKEIEGHPSIRLFIGNRSTLISTSEDGKKTYKWTVFVKTDPVLPDSSSESDEETVVENAGLDQSKQSADVTAASEAAIEKGAGGQTAHDDATSETTGTDTASTAESTQPSVTASIEGKPLKPVDGKIADQGPTSSEQSQVEVNSTAVAAKASAAEKATKQQQKVQARAEAEAGAASFLKSVTYVLHESYDPPIVTVKDAPFEVTREGWGIFVVQLHIVSNGGHELDFNHALSFSKSMTKKVYEVDLMTGKLIRRRLKVEAPAARRPERTRVIVKPRDLEDFVDSSTNKPIVPGANKPIVPGLTNVQKQSKQSSASTKRKRQQDLGVSKSVAEASGTGASGTTDPIAYDDWKRQVLGRKPGEDATGSVVSPQWLKHFQHVSSTKRKSLGDATVRELPNKWRRVVKCHTRVHRMDSDHTVMGLTDLEALQALWPKMHQAVAIAMHKLPAIRSADGPSSRVARYLLSQYKLAQMQADAQPLTEPDSPKPPTAITDVDEKTMLVDVPGAKLRAPIQLSHNNAPLLSLGGLLPVQAAADTVIDQHDDDESAAGTQRMGVASQVDDASAEDVGNAVDRSVDGNHSVVEPMDLSSCAAPDSSTPTESNCGQQSDDDAASVSEGSPTPTGTNVRPTKVPTEEETNSDGGPSSSEQTPALKSVNSAYTVVCYGWLTSSAVSIVLTVSLAHGAGAPSAD